jgi:hypothetical protein
MNIQSALVRSILEQWRSYTWTVQGLGMLRTKIADVGRIHVWDSRLRVPLVSDIHSHPWDLRSLVVSGELLNQRFNAETERGAARRLPYTAQALQCGEGGGLLEKPYDIWLEALAPEVLFPGDTYTQAMNNLHRSLPQDGTVTLMERQESAEACHAVVCWPRGTQWVSAEPKPAETWQLQPAIDYALARWNAV